MEELVSVIIPVYNRQETIARALDSVLEQTYENMEVIIVDDGSSDDTMEILKSYSDSRIRILSQNHKGACAARNRGIDEAKGKYIAFQDSDDEWMSEKLCKQIIYMKRKDFKVCYCPHLLYDDKIKTIPQEYLLTDKYEDNIGDTLKSGNVISTQTLVVEKSVLDAVGKFDEEMPRLQDYELIIRIVQRYKIGYYAEALVKVYRQPISISNDNSAYKEAVYQLIKQHGHFFEHEYMKSMIFSTAEFVQEDDIEYLHRLHRVSGVPIEESFIRVAKEHFPLLSLFRLWQKHQYIGFEEKLRTGEFFIYGAGKYAKRVFAVLLEKNLKPKSFLVSSADDAGGDIQGIPVENLKEDDKKMPVLIAVGLKKQEEIMRYLDEKGVEDYCAYPLFELQ